MSCRDRPCRNELTGTTSVCVCKGLSSRNSSAEIRAAAKQFSRFMPRRGVGVLGMTLLNPRLGAPASICMMTSLISASKDDSATSCFVSSSILRTVANKVRTTPGAAAMVVLVSALDWEHACTFQFPTYYTDFLPPYEGHTNKRDGQERFGEC